jgi:hypothetical protein
MVKIQGRPLKFIYNENHSTYEELLAKWNRYQNKFHIGGINFPMKNVPGTNFSFKKFRQNKFSVK